ncbi:ilvB operon leader peptide IvbL [Buttiauxella noackiae]|nr:ilvB operon leader peptide IvbL [Buttiauxella noackiae]
MTTFTRNSGLLLTALPAAVVVVRVVVVVVGNAP